MLQKVSLPGKEITLIGTAHISKDSVQLVKETIESEKPEVVGVELDFERFKQLQSHNRWRNTNISEIIKSGKIYLFLFNLMLANMQAKLGREFGIAPGAEFLEATKISKENNIPVALLDRNIKITMKRLISKMSFFEKLKLFYAIIGSFFGYGDKITQEKLDELKDKDVISEMVKELEGSMPNIKTVLVDERDLYLAQKIKSINARKIVAVVGAGHLTGIQKALEKDVDIRELEMIPKSRNYLGYLKYIVPIIFVAILGYGFLVKGIAVSLSILFYWIVINGMLAGLGVLIARGHVFSILTAFAAAPFTSLHPFLAAGWFAGLMEIKMRMPKVKDFEGLKQLNTLGDFYNNQITHILLVTALANLGSTIGTIVALPYLISLLG